MYISAFGIEVMTDYERAKKDYEDKLQIYYQSLAETDKLWHEMHNAFERYLWYENNEPVNKWHEK